MKPPLGMTTILAALAALCLLMAPVAANAAPSFMSDMEGILERARSKDAEVRSVLVVTDGSRKVS
ncbi:MAG: hypothetical protein LBQ36_10110, partial [Synergistaceae bacterium]|nr:hypothetical protein [Synergistaceae bacterium]